MKKINKNICSVTRLWPSAEDMKKDLFIDLDKQEIINLLTGNKFKFYLAGNKNHPYYRIFFKQTHIRVHRLFFYWKHGYLPSLVDHKDRNTLNNNIDNLRELDSKGNAMNSCKKNRKNSSSKYKGVTKIGNKWRARVQPFGVKEIYIGSFDLEDDAGQAYNDKIRELGLEEVSVLNDTPQERGRKLNLFENLEPITNLK
jgi:hypothetical protein